MRLSTTILLAALSATSAASASAASAAAPTQPQHRRLIAEFRAYIAEVNEIEGRLQGDVTITGGGAFSDLGKVGFILRGANLFPRRYLHPDDHDFVYSAVRGQTDPELEANLPAMINYIRLATAARMYNYRARSQQPLIGRRRGIDLVGGLAKRIYDFREQQVERIKAGALRPSQVLTTANLGEFADPALFDSLQMAYRAGQSQVANQRNSVVLVVVGVELAVSFVIAVVFLRRTRPLTVIEQTGG